MQPFPSPQQPDRRGRFTLIALLVAALLVASTIAIVELVQLRAANERIEELESRPGSSAQGQGEGDGGLFGDFDDIFEDLLGDSGGLFEGAGDLGSLIECIGNPFAGSGEAGTSVEEIARQVEGIRELTFDREVEPSFLSDDEMNSRVRELFLEEYTPKLADIEQRILTTLGAIPPGTDLRELLSGAVGQQVAGFYEPETGELVVRQSGSEPSAIDRITLAHELDHALTDQALGIPLPDDPQLGAEDSSLAALAVVEGDATLAMQRYSATLGFAEQFELLDPATIAQAEAGLEDFPYYLEQQLLFPYEQGLNFVCGLYAEGGWEAVNRAYEDPPDSTAQILFPERYMEGGQPVDPRDPGRPGEGWERVGKFELGAANLLWLFSAPGGDPTKALADPRAAADEWAGGEVELWSDGERTALGLYLAQEGGDSGTLCEAVDEWYRASVPDDTEQVPDPYYLLADGSVKDAALFCPGSEVFLGIAPELATARALVHR